MQKEIIGTLFILFIAFSAIIFADLNTTASVFIGGGATLITTFKLVGMDMEGVNE